MSSSEFVKPLILRPEASFGILSFIFLLHAIASVFVVFFLPVPAGVSGVVLLLLLVGLIVGSLIYYYRLHISKGLKKSVIQASLDSRGFWEIQTAMKQTFQVELQSSSFVSLPLVVLNFRAQNRKSYTLLLAADALDTDILRQLRVRLKTM